MTTITLARARVAADAALAKGSELGLRMSVVVVDAAGVEIVGLRSDGATWFTIEVARAKAKTVAVFGRDSGSLQALRDLYPEVFTLAGDEVAFRPTTLAGGLAVSIDGVVVGAVGVSGALPEQDVECGEVAHAILSVA